MPYRAFRVSILSKNTNLLSCLVKIRTIAITIPNDRLRTYPPSSLKRCERLERVPILALLDSFTGVPGAGKRSGLTAWYFGINATWWVGAYIIEKEIFTGTRWSYASCRSSTMWLIVCHKYHCAISRQLRSLWYSKDGFNFKQVLRKTCMAADCLHFKATKTTGGKEWRRRTRLDQIKSATVRQYERYEQQYLCESHRVAAWSELGRPCHPFS